MILSNQTSGCFTLTFIARDVFKIFLRVFLILALAAAGLPAFSLEKVSITKSTDSIQIGEQFTVTLELGMKDGKKVVWPTFQRYLAENIEILNVLPLDTVQIAGRQTILRQQIIGTSFVPGFHPIPPLVFALVENADTLMVETEPILISVYGVVIPEDAVPYDIKPIYAMPISFLEIMRILVPVLGFTLLLVWIWKIIQKRRKGQTLIPKISQQPELEPHVIALQNLEALKTKHLWQSGKVKQYYTELTLILRIYLEKRFSIMALEATTDEVLEELHLHTGVQSSRNVLKNVLTTGDLVKFAKLAPEPRINELRMEEAIEFVKGTILEIPHVDSTPQKVQSVLEKANPNNSN